MTEDEALRFVLKMALRNALKLVRGLRKQIGDREEDLIVLALIREIELSAYTVVKRAGTTGHTFDPPTGPQTRTSGSV